ncbi:hypothetical protein E2C01_000506 [Portunus trituberculatus]|uniref:Uncharacterized protein n=1 Tax=Portunus trituberculatus TaxID=210409 RepID=A0A5B7CFF3_PORTR|nr:hypothetical protein [Portunus trituberculatus]
MEKCRIVSSLLQSSYQQKLLWLGKEVGQEDVEEEEYDHCEMTSGSWAARLVGHVTSPVQSAHTLHHPVQHPTIRHLLQGEGHHLTGVWVSMKGLPTGKCWGHTRTYLNVHFLSLRLLHLVLAGHQHVFVDLLLEALLCVGLQVEHDSLHSSRSRRHHYHHHSHLGTPHVAWRCSLALHALRTCCCCCCTPSHCDKEAALESDSRRRSGVVVMMAAAAAASSTPRQPSLPPPSPWTALPLLIFYHLLSVFHSDI